MLPSGGRQAKARERRPNWLASFNAKLVARRSRLEIARRPSLFAEDDEDRHQNTGHKLDWLTSVHSIWSSEQQTRAFGAISPQRTCRSNLHKQTYAKLVHSHKQIDRQVPRHTGQLSWRDRRWLHQYLAVGVSLCHSNGNTDSPVPMMTLLQLVTG